MKCEVRSIKKYEGENLDKKVEDLSKILPDNEIRKISSVLYLVEHFTPKCVNPDCKYSVKYGVDMYCTNINRKNEYDVK